MKGQVMVCMCTQSLCHVLLFETPWTVAHQTPLFMEFPRQEYWSRLPLSSPGDLPNPGNKPTSLALAGELFTTEPNPHRPLYPAPKEGPVMSTKMRSQILRGLKKSYKAERSKRLLEDHTDKSKIKAS